MDSLESIPDDLWPVVLDFMREVRGEKLSVAEEVRRQDLFSAGREPEVMAAVSLVAEHVQRVLLRHIEGEPLSTREQELFEETTRSMEWFFAQPENREERDRILAETISATGRNFAEAVAQGSPYGENFAALWLHAMNRLREEDPDLARRIEEEE